MKTPALRIQLLGQIREASLTFGDLTVFVGSQATGKGIALLLLTLMVDAGHVREEMSRYGIDWSGKLPDMMDAYFGEGMRSIWTNGKSHVDWEGKPVDLQQIARHKRKAADEYLFYIQPSVYWRCAMAGPAPSQITLRGDPFAVREFSETRVGRIQWARQRRCRACCG